MIRGDNTKKNSVNVTLISRASQIAQNLNIQLQLNKEWINEVNSNNFPLWQYGKPYKH